MQIPPEQLGERMNNGKMLMVDITPDQLRHLADIMEQQAKLGAVGAIHTSIGKIPLSEPIRNAIYYNGRAHVILRWPRV